jgi:hypothetical protein
MSPLSVKVVKCAPRQIFLLHAAQLVMAIQACGRSGIVT